MTIATLRPGDLMTVSQAAAARGMYPQSVRRAIAEGRLPAVRIGSMWVIARADLDAYAPAYTGRPKAAPAADGEPAPRHYPEPGEDR